MTTVICSYSKLVFRTLNTLKSVTQPAKCNHFKFQRLENFNNRRFYCRKLSDNIPNGEQILQKSGLWQRLKSMCRDYWYIAIPVHFTTSCMWFGSLYYVSRSGVDIKKYMKMMGFSNTIIDKVANSGAGDLAVAYALYNVVTPARYAATIGCSTYAINFLKSRGYIRTAKQISQSSRDMYVKHRDLYRANRAAAADAGRVHKGKGQSG